MIATIRFNIPSKQTTIELKDYGHECKWSELSSEEQSEILDSIREDFVVSVTGENYV